MHPTLLGLYAFDNTIFVFVADHCAGSAGNTDVPLWRYQIPAMFYAPEIIKPKVFAKNTSQINLAPTLLGFLNLSYKSKFFPDRPRISQRGAVTLIR